MDKGRRDEGRALHPRYYAQHPESGTKMGGGRVHYVDAAGGYLFKIKDIAAGLLVWRQPRAVTQPITAAHPPKSVLQLSPSASVVNKLARSGEAPPSDLLLVVDGYPNIVGPRQKTGVVKVQGLAALRDELERVKEAVK